MVEDGELGDVYHSHSQRVSLGAGRSDENALWSVAPHDISVIVQLMLEEPEHVEATAPSFLQPRIDDVQATRKVRIYGERRHGAYGLRSKSPGGQLTVSGGALEALGLV